MISVGPVSEVSNGSLESEHKPQATQSKDDAIPGCSELNEDKIRSGYVKIVFAC